MKNNNKTLNISEIFGPTLQGEGKLFGQPCIFIRTSGCNLRCEWINKDGSLTKCDTAYTSWNVKGNYDKYSIERILYEVDQLIDDFYDKKDILINNIVISGGEPFLQPNIVDLITALKVREYFVTVETNGTIFRESKTDLVSISPKLSSSESKSCDIAKSIHQKNRVYNYSNIKKFYTCNQCQIKFVYSCRDDLKEILQFVQKFSINRENVYLMPQGEISKTILENTKDCFDVCVENGFNMTHRLHILAYEDKRKV